MDAAISKSSFLFDLDGTLVDSVYQHVLAWREALEAEGIDVSIWRIHRKIGTSGGLLTDMLLRETGLGIELEGSERLRFSDAGKTCSPRAHAAGVRKPARRYLSQRIRISLLYRHVSFETLLGLAADKEPASYWDIIKQDNPRKSASRAGSAPLLHIDEPESAG